MSKAKRKALIFAAIVVVIVALFVSLGLFEQTEAAGRLASARAKAKENGIPLTLAEFKKGLPDPKDPRNAWPDYVAAVRLYHPEFDPSKQPMGPPGGFPSQIGQEPARTPRGVIQGVYRNLRRGRDGWDADPELDSALQELRPALEAIRRAQEKPMLIPDKPWEKGHIMTMAEAPELMMLARLFYLEAIFAARAGDLEGSVEHLKHGARISNDLTSQPILGYQVFGASLAQDGLAVMSWLLCSRTWPAEEALLFEPVLAMLSTRGNLLAAFKNNVFAGLMTIEATSAPENLDDVPQGWENGMRVTPRPGAREDAERDWLESANKILARWPKEDSISEAIRTALGEEDAAMNNVLDLFYRTRGRPTSETGPTGRALDAIAARDAQFLLLRRMMNLLEHRRLTGAFPKELPAMEIDGKPALDPFSGKPLRYMLDKGGFILYSVGRDRRDDKGTARSDNGVVVDLVIAYPSSRIVW